MVLVLTTSTGVMHASVMSTRSWMKMVTPVKVGVFCLSNLLRELRRYCFMLLCMILGKSGTGKNGTNGKVGKNGTLVLNFPKPSTRNPNPKPLNPNSKLPTPTPHPNIRNVPLLPALPFVPLLRVPFYRANFTGHRYSYILSYFSHIFSWCSIHVFHIAEIASMHLIVNRMLRIYNSIEWVFIYNSWESVCIY